LSKNPKFTVGFSVSLAQRLIVGKFFYRAYDKFTLQYLANKYDVDGNLIEIELGEFWTLFKVFFLDPRLIGAWEAFFENPKLRKNVPLLTYTSDHFDELSSIKQSLREVSDQDAFIANINSRPFAHTPSSGAIVYSHLEEGTYLIGGFPPDLQYILDGLAYPKMDPLNTDFPLPTGQRFNMLNVSDQVYQQYINADVGFFRSVNGPWIDHGVSRGVPFVVVSDVSQYLYKIEDGVQGLTGFGKEIHRLEWLHGYRYDPATKRMLPPPESGGLPALTNVSDYDHEF
jgi:hypothetical protein